MLDDLLQYHSQPESGDFVARVMQGVERQQKLRNRILWLCGLVGAVFGVIGASLLADTVERFAAQLFAANTAVATGSAVIALLAFLAWLLQDEPGTSL
ncbi:MAG TPA: hypothetical protein VFG52_04445 [Xanthomonadales bacterium]|nr:hypothetical protein [Xanthomonadales bacterium]